MSDYPLFLGFRLSESFLRKLADVPPHLYAVFIHEKPSDYLQKVECEGVFYLGKPVDSPCDMGTLETLQKNVYSLLKRIVPEYPYEQFPLLLFPLFPKEESNG